MVSRRAAHRDPLDALVQKVWHVELSACENYAEFREGVRRMTDNLDLTLAALAGLELSDVRIRHAADQVKLNALRLLELCRELPEALQGPEDWRHKMAAILAMYEQFRNEAGHLYGSRRPRRPSTCCGWRCEATLCEATMVRGRRKEPEPALLRGPCQGAKIGTVLLDLHDAIRSAQQCRQTLHALGISRKEWMEIVEDVDPDLRFLARPQELDVIVALLEKAGEPLDRATLVQALLVQGGSSRQVRYCIHRYLRNGRLTLYPSDKIGLPEWSTTAQ